MSRANLSLWNKKELQAAALNVDANADKRRTKGKRFFETFFTLFVPNAFMCDPIICLSLQKVEEKHRES